MVPATASLDPLGAALAAATKGEFSVLGFLGRGGMASVYLAKDRGLDRLVAIKVLQPDLLARNPAAADRFVLEARIAAGLAHPHIIPIFSVRQTPGLHFFAMGFVDGWPLDAVLRQRGPLPPAAVRSVLAQAASALAFAHRKGVVHRDLKPGNIMVDLDGRAVLLDFGIAKVAAAEAMTQSGTAIGTPIYMSPEQCRGLEATGASDQYALGVLAYELLAGRPPFSSENTFGMIYQHVHQAPVPLTERVPGVPPELSGAIMRMLAKDPAERWPSLAELADVLGPSRAADEAELREAILRESADLRHHPAVPRHPAPEAAPAPAPSLPASPVAAVPDAELPPAAARGPAPAPAARPAAAPAAFSATGAVAVATAPPFTLAEAAGAIRMRTTPVPGRTAEFTTEGPLPVPREASRTPVHTDTLTSELHVGQVRLELAPRRSTLTLGQQIDLTGLLAHPIPADHPVEWVSEDPSIVRVTPDGKAFAERTGTVTVLVRDLIGEARARLEVTRVEVARVRLTSPSPSLSVGDAVTLVATVLDRLGSVLEHRYVAWRVSDPRLATISSTGVLTGRSPGLVTVIATCGALSAELDLKVGPERLTGVLVLPRALSLQVGEGAVLQAVPLTARGQSRHPRPVSWGTTNPAVVQVFEDGSVLARAKGLARISAVIEGFRGYVPVEVRSADDR